MHPWYCILGLACLLPSAWAVYLPQRAAFSSPWTSQLQCESHDPYTTNPERCPAVWLPLWRFHPHEEVLRILEVDRILREMEEKMLNDMRELEASYERSLLQVRIDQSITDFWIRYALERAQGGGGGSAAHESAG